MKLFKRILFVLVAIYVVICVGLYFFQEKLLFHPYKLADNYQFVFPGKYREYYMDMGNGCRINALQFYADTPARGVVIYFHGNGEALDYTGTKAAVFTSRGYDCIMMDYPGYGKSTGEISQKALFDIGTAFMDSAKKHYSSGRIVLYGRSLGTGIAAHTARAGEWFKTLILEAPYYSIVDIGQRQYPFIPVKWLSRYPISTYLYLKDLQHPVYAIHGTLDRVIPIESPRQFLNLGLNEFSLTVIEGAQHGNLADYKQYDEMLDKALK
jgi:hypothetical protein